ncbi:preprotein translocase subunit YajC [Eikenella sp. S3360]|uniref:Sec translocon accessory complex subunit YajC n=1 Tax=Eikenella glucosivorans TaxID=2766967 RepID=A0ABS0N9F5_9NEIS|nr:preprotein translocase subunit YajC [Eikenella glucosivorans]MBH5328931.1 preprotein translocase subunit YajC [Eikenella glucosivorans]
MFQFIIADGVTTSADFVKNVLPLLLLMGMLYLMIIRPKQREEKRRRQMLTELKKGDKVMTNSGMLGKVWKIGDDIIGLEVSPDTVIEFHRDAILKKLDN